MHEPRLRPLAIVAAALVMVVGGVAVALGTSAVSGDRAAQVGVRYSAQRADTICGLDDVRCLSNPARVRFEELMDATPERERIRREGIDPVSAMGQILESKARRRVTAACAVVMRRLSHCSVWKAITRSDGQKISDITVQVRAEFGEVTLEPTTAQSTD